MKKEFSPKEKTQYKFLLNVLGSLFSNIPLENNNQIDFRDLYFTSAKSRVANMVSYALEKSKINVPKEIMNMFVRCRKFMLMKDASQFSATIKLISEFENQEIDNLLVKGQFIKDTYPQPDFRVTNDVDVHIKSNDIEKARTILSSLDYRIIESTDDLIVAVQDPFVQFEIHCDNGNFRNSTFTENLFSNANLVDNTNHTYKFTDEYHYIYIVEHFAKHYRDLGGMGVRMIIDVYFLNKYLKNNNADYDFINEKLKENNLTKFHNMLLEKADLYFNKGIKDFDDVDVYILSNMTFGTQENRILNERRKYNEEYNNSTEENYIKSRIFPPYKRMVEEYPGLKNKKLLLPLYWLHRDFKILTSKNLKQYQENLSEYKKYDNKEEIDFLDNVMKKSGF